MEAGARFLKGVDRGKEVTAGGKTVEGAKTAGQLWREGEAIASGITGAAQNTEKFAGKWPAPNTRPSPCPRHSHAGSDACG